MTLLPRINKPIFFYCGTSLEASMTVIWSTLSLQVHNHINIYAS